MNLGVGNEIKIKDLVDHIKDITNFQGEDVWDTTKPDGQPRRQLDTTLAANTIGFKAGTPFEVGLKSTIDWYERSQ